MDSGLNVATGALKLGSSVTLGAAMMTGRPSIIAMAAVMTAGAYVMRPAMAMRVAERIGERIAERMGSW